MSSNLTWPGLVCGAILLGGHGFCSAAAASPPAPPQAQAAEAGHSNPYADIITRNAFRLQPQPPPPPPPSAPTPDLPEVIFSGTMINKGQIKAMFAVKVKEPKEVGAKNAAGGQETTKYITLKETDIWHSLDSQAAVELMRIAPGGDEVEIINSGTRQVLTLKDNGFEKKIPKGGGGGGPPGLRQIPGGNPNLPMPVGVPGQPVTQNAAYGGGIIGGGPGGIIGGGRGGNMNPSGIIGGGAPMNASGPVPPQPGGMTVPSGYATGNTSPIVSGGARALPNPFSAPPPSGMNAISISSPGNLGSAASLQPNSTPVGGSSNYRGPLPPAPPIPGQKQD